MDNLELISIINSRRRWGFKIWANLIWSLTDFFSEHFHDTAAERLCRNAMEMCGVIYDPLEPLVLALLMF